MKKLLLSVAILFVATYWLSQENKSNDVNERVNGNDVAELVSDVKTEPLN
ncbi:hypothetical protein JYT89_01120 [Flavobacteriaceae bacterium AH-315-B10]|nr:hypothetical protein [Flavobacteriaceae bacterium AH-315-B10]